MKRLLVFLLVLLASPASPHDALLRADTLAHAKAFLTFLGDQDISLATPYAQGSKGGVSYFLVFAGGGTGRLLIQTGTTTNQFGQTVPVYGPYDTYLYAVIRWNGNLGTLTLPTGIEAIIVDGLSVVATGGDGVTTITDTFDQTPTTAPIIPAAVLATSTSIM